MFSLKNIHTKNLINLAYTRNKMKSFQLYFKYKLFKIKINHVHLSEDFRNVY